jgi:hypothetical protein
MKKITHQWLSVLLGISTLGVISHSTSAQELNPELNQDKQKIEIQTIQQESTGQPNPGTTATTLAAFTPTVNPTISQFNSPNYGIVTAQNTTDPEIIFRHDYSYIGLGGNVGVESEQTSLGETGFVINGKIALAQELSLRPAVIFGDDTVFLVPITYDITLKDKDPFKEVPFVPFIGGGAVFTTNSDNNAGFLITGGVDWRLSENFVANAGLHVGFIEDSTDIGLILGVGYIIPQKSR